MAAGFTMKKNNIKLLDNFIQADFTKKNINKKNLNKYDLEISSSAIKSGFINDIYRLGPFGNFNHLPIFLIKNLKVIKFNVFKNKHISAIMKPLIINLEISFRLSPTFSINAIYSSTKVLLNESGSSVLTVHRIPFFKNSLIGWSVQLFMTFNL